jgi:hypothetical protein
MEFKGVKKMTKKKMMPKELRAWRIQHCRKIQQKGAEARRKKARERREGIRDPNTGLLDRSQYMTYKDIKSCYFRFFSILVGETWL